ncbi:MAG: hypothetical protein M4579_001460 [Chaenotheca gracillima]|nr:MAG: hypothetical protein M4579_001460 [Chaenotheca gracillima]
MSRPPLKLKLTTSDQHTSTSQRNGETPSAASATPKLKLKFGSGSSKPTTPAAVGPAKEKKPRKPKTVALATTNGSGVSAGTKRKVKVREVEDDEDDEDTIEVAAPGSSSKPKIKKLKITNKKPFNPIIKAKLKGRPPPRPMGVGYDSESPDREIDPAIEEEFVLRMAPGEDCDYLRQAIEEKKMGLSRAEGGADVSMKFLNREGRRAVVTIRQKHYAATMVDLPCVVEGMKSWDKRGWWKSADICQMLLVLGPVASEEMALTFPLPPQIDTKTYQYPHGLTPPTHNVRKRRFRKRISNRTIEAVEDEVERLLAADLESVPGSSRYDILDLDRLTRDNSAAYSESDGGFDLLGNAGMNDADEEDDDEDAEGEIVEDEIMNGGETPGGLEADLEMAMMMDNSNVEVPVSGATAEAVENALNDVQTPSADAADSENEESSDEDAEDDEGAQPEIDEDALERQQDLQRQREEIADLEAAIESQTVELNRLTNPILRDKLVKKIISLRSDLALKKGSSGEDAEDE